MLEPTASPTPQMKHQRLRGESAAQGRLQALQTHDDHTRLPHSHPCPGRAPSSVFTAGSLGPSRGRTHPGQVAEPQLQGVAQPVGMVGLHVSPEALRGAGGPWDALQHGLCMDLVWEGWLAPLEGSRHLGMGAHPGREKETLTRGEEVPGTPSEPQAAPERAFTLRAGPLLGD